MTWICYRGIELSARIQQLLLGAEVVILAIFSVVALVEGLRQPSAARLDPADRPRGSTRSR